jgi:hypothetical protein
MNTAKQQANLRHKQHIWHHQEGIELALKFETKKKKITHTHTLYGIETQPRYSKPASLLLISDTQATLRMFSLFSISVELSW